ncbi:MAG: discoidin domain-containing protein [Clostridia bacterium]|nr:discoidin domain-containing protein [Clostridia bacterium]
MKKLIATLLLAGLTAALIPMSVSAANSDNLAAGLSGDSVLTSYSHEDGAWNWGKANLNDGDLFEIIVRPGTTNGEASGYHSNFGASMPDPQFVGYNFGEKKTFNTLIAYAVGTNTFPIDFEIQVSDNGTDWTPVLTKTDYTVVGGNTGFLPQTFTFESQTAQYVRLYATKLNNDGANYAMKLTEVEVFNITDPVVEPENLAANKPVTSDSAHSDGSWWVLTNINDNDFKNMSVSPLDYGQFAGYHTSPSTPRDGSDAAKAQFTIELGEGTKFDKVVIQPSNELYSVKTLRGAPDDASNPDGIYFPENFRIQISDDGETWTDVVVKENYVCDSADPQVFTFDQVTAKYVRFQMEKLTKFIKLTEFAVYNETVEEEPAPGTEPGTEPEPTPDPVPTGDVLLTVSFAALAATTALVVVARRRKVTE